MLVHGISLIEQDDKVIDHQRKTGEPFESQSVKAWKEACKHGGLAIDVGAYTGLYSFLAEKHGAERVLAYEPNLDVFFRLLENIVNNKSSVIAYHKAVSEFNGRCGMILKRAKLTSGGKVTEGMTVETVTLDSVIHPEETVCAIKVDTEGHECQVLRGAVETIKRCQPLLVTEALGDEEYAEQAAILYPLGYTGKHVDQWNYIWSPKSAY